MAQSVNRIGHRSAAWLRAAATSWLSLLLLFTGVGAQAQPAGREFSDEQVKAALVLHFVKKTEWPASAQNGEEKALIIGVVGSPIFARQLRTLASGDGGLDPGVEKTTGTRVKVVELEKGSDPSTCQAVYFGADDKATRDLLEKAAGKPILTIGEGREFTEAGGVFGFERVQRRIRYWFSPDAMGRSGLRVDVAVTRLQLKAGSPRSEE